MTASQEASSVVKISLVGAAGKALVHLFFDLGNDGLELASKAGFKLANWCSVTERLVSGEFLTPVFL
jgi:hypothetical protein